MPPKTNTEKIDELRDALTNVQIRLGNLERIAEQSAPLRRELTEQIRTEVGQLTALVSELRKLLDDHRDRLTRLEQTVAELKSRRDEWGRRGWAVVQTLLGAVAGGAVMYFARR